MREENVRLQRKLQREMERREALCRQLSESESSLEMDDERYNHHRTALACLSLSVRLSLSALSPYMYSMFTACFLASQLSIYHTPILFCIFIFIYFYFILELYLLISSEHYITLHQEKTTLMPQYCDIQNLTRYLVSYHDIEI